MINYTLQRRFYYLKQLLKHHIAIHKTYYIIGCICFLLGFVTGIFSAVKYASLVEVGHISDTVLISFLAGEASIFGLFFARIVSYLFLSIIITLICGVFYLIPFSYIILIYKSFIAALTVSFLIVLYGFSGVLLTIFVILPTYILFYFAFIALISICVKRCLVCKKYGAVYFSDQVYCFPLRSIFNILLIMLAGCLIEILFLPIISATFIVII
jgi:hypothetical protein